MEQVSLETIRRRPTVMHNSHESVLRSYWIVQKVKELLVNKTPAKVVLEIIADLESAPQDKIMTVEEAIDESLKELFRPHEGGVGEPAHGG